MIVQFQEKLHRLPIFSELSVFTRNCTRLSKLCPAYYKLQGWSSAVVKSWHWLSLTTGGKGRGMLNIGNVQILNSSSIFNTQIWAGWINYFKISRWRWGWDDAGWARQAQYVYQFIQHPSSCETKKPCKSPAWTTLNKKSRSINVCVSHQGAPHFRNSMHCNQYGHMAVGLKRRQKQEMAHCLEIGIREARCWRLFLWKYDCQRWEIQVL